MEKLSIPSAQRSALTPEKITKMAAAATTKFSCMMVCSDVQDTGVVRCRCEML